MRDRGRQTWRNAECSYWEFGYGNVLRPIPYDKTKIYIATGASSADEAEQAISDGHGFSFTGLDFYAEIYTDEQVCLASNGYGLRTKKYFEGVCASIGLLSTEEREYGCPVNGDVVGFLDVVVVTTEVATIYKTEETFTVSVGYWAGPEELPEIRFVFDHLPTKSDIDIALILRRATNGFMAGLYHDTYTCPGCEKTVHWLDLPGNLRQRLALSRDGYCDDC